MNWKALKIKILLKVALGMVRKLIFKIAKKGIHQNSLALKNGIKQHCNIIIIIILIIMVLFPQDKDTHPMLQLSWIP